MKIKVNFSNSFHEIHYKEIRFLINYFSSWWWYSNRNTNITFKSKGSFYELIKKIKLQTESNTITN
jgi:hypothetical protein